LPLRAVKGELQHPSSLYSVRSIRCQFLWTAPTSSCRTCLFRNLPQGRSALSTAAPSVSLERVKAITSLSGGNFFDSGSLSGFSLHSLEHPSLNPLSQSLFQVRFQKNVLVPRFFLPFSLLDVPYISRGCGQNTHPGLGRAKKFKILSYFSPSRCSLISRGVRQCRIGSEAGAIMKIRGHIRSGHTLFLTFSDLRASLIVEGCQWQRVSIGFPASKGDGCMKDTNHRVRHPRVHLDDRATAPRTRGCAWRDDQFGRGQNTVLGWSDPTFAHGSVAKVMHGSLQPNKKLHSVRAARIWAKQRRGNETIFPGMAH
jgi:hypothetical protein